MFKGVWIFCLLGTASGLSASGETTGRRVFVGTPVQRHRCVEDCMTSDPYTLDVSTPTDEAITFLLQKGLSGAPVVDETKSLVGMLSSYDFVQKEAFSGALLNMEGSEEQVQLYVEAAKKIAAQGVEEVMTHKPATVSPTTSMREAAVIMSQQKLHHLPVVNNDKVVGILSSSDVMKDLLQISKSLPQAKDDDEESGSVSP